VVPSHILPLAQSPVPAHEQDFVINVLSVHSNTSAHLEPGLKLVSQTCPVVQASPLQSHGTNVYS